MLIKYQWNFRPHTIGFENLLLFSDAIEHLDDDLEDDESNDIVEEDPEPDPGTEEALEYGRFEPPLYKQRYNYALEILKSSWWIQAMSRIVDIGCAGFRIF